MTVGGLCQQHGRALAEGVGPEWILFATSHIALKAMFIGGQTYDHDAEFAEAVNASPSRCIVCFLDHPQWIKQAIDFTRITEATNREMEKATRQGVVVFVPE